MVLGGSFAFAGLGGYLGVQIGLQIVNGPDFKNSPSPGAGIGAVIVFLFVAVIGAVVGASVGYLASFLMSRVPALKWVQIPLAILGYGIVIAGIVSLYMVLSPTQTQASIQAAETSQAHSEQLIAQRNVEFIRQANIDLPALMGDLIYQGSKVVGGRTLGRSYPLVAFETKATLEDLSAYYRPMLVESQGSGSKGLGIVRRPGDGMFLRVSLRNVGEGRQIIFESVAKSSVAVASPSAAPPVEQSVFSRSPDWPLATLNREVITAYGPLVYPRSHTNFASTTPPRSDIPASMVILASEDSMESTVAYYRPLVDAKVDRQDQFVGMTTRRSDGKRTFVSVQRKDGLTFISLSAG